MLSNSIGTRLINSDEKEIVVEEIYREKVQDDSVKVYNFQVEDYHTYYVGRTYCLVHNGDYKYPYTETQEQLRQEGKKISNRNNISAAEAEDYIDRCRQNDIPYEVARIDPPHYSRMDNTKLMDGVSGKYHLHVPVKGSNSHVEINDPQNLSIYTGR